MGVWPRKIALQFQYFLDSKKEGKRGAQKYKYAIFLFIATKKLSEFLHPILLKKRLSNGFIKVEAVVYTIVFTRFNFYVFPWMFLPPTSSFH